MMFLDANSTFWHFCTVLPHLINLPNEPAKLCQSTNHDEAQPCSTSCLRLFETIAAQLMCIFKVHHGAQCHFSRRLCFQMHLAKRVNRSDVNTSTQLFSAQLNGGHYRHDRQILDFRGFHCTLIVLSTRFQYLAVVVVIVVDLA